MLDAVIRVLGRAHADPAQVRRLRIDVAVGRRVWEFKKATSPTATFAEAKSQRFAIVDLLLGLPDEIDSTHALVLKAHRKIKRAAAYLQRADAPPLSPDSSEGGVFPLFYLPPCPSPHQAGPLTLGVMSLSSLQPAALSLMTRH